MRSLSRETVFKYLFSQLFNPDDEGLFDVMCKQLNDSDKQFAESLLSATMNGKEKYLQSVEKLVKGYKINRLYNVDKCILIMGMAELDNFTETPVPVVIDEAVNLVAKYSTENSTDFVNGVLAEYVKEKE